MGETQRAAENLEATLLDIQEELKATKRQRIRDIMKHPEQETALEETYDELESDLLCRMEGIQNQLTMAQNRRNTIIRVNRVAKTALEVFDDILRKPKLDRNDLNLIIEKIRVFEDHIEVQLKADVDSILRSGTLPEELPGQEPEAVAAMAPASIPLSRQMAGDSQPYEIQIIQESDKHKGKTFTVKVISNGDPLEIYTDKDGEVIFKKYSLMGGLSDFAAQMCETLNKTTGRVCVITDRDSCIAVSGAPRRDLMEKRLSERLERILEGRKIYQYQPGEAPMPISDEANRFFVICAAPILAEGDVLGSVLIAGEEGELGSGETEYKLLQTMSGFLGRHMEG